MGAYKKARERRLGSTILSYRFLPLRSAASGSAHLRARVVNKNQTDRPGKGLTHFSCLPSRVFASLSTGPPRDCGALKSPAPSALHGGTTVTVIRSDLKTWELAR